ncbi:MAG TPA: YicC/YloC family endoribonuclease, partial [Vicinamibacteria bacterium]|nr:YicC/YloC family endoribonuclease [Vicinamibacteria bacterium]
MSAQRPLRSMTGYGSSALENEALKASVTVRSLNHRYLDVSVHLSRRLLAMEADVRRAVQGRLQRGRVEVAVQAWVRDQEGEAVVPNRGLIAALVHALRDVQSDHALPGEIHVTDVMRFPGAFESQEAASA